jgi:hypothetical protein
LAVELGLIKSDGQESLKLLDNKPFFLGKIVIISINQVVLIMMCQTEPTQLWEEALKEDPKKLTDYQTFIVLDSGGGDFNKLSENSLPYGF